MIDLQLEKGLFKLLSLVLIILAFYIIIAKDFLRKYKKITIIDIIFFIILSLIIISIFLFYGAYVRYILDFIKYPFIFFLIFSQLSKYFGLKVKNQILVSILGFVIGFLLYLIIYNYD